MQKIYVFFGDTDGQRSMNFSHALAGALLVIAGVAYRMLT